MAEIFSSGDGYATEIGSIPDILGPDSRFVESLTIEGRIGIGELEDRLETMPLDGLETLSGFPLGPVQRGISKGGCEGFGDHGCLRVNVAISTSLS